MKRKKVKHQAHGKTEKFVPSTLAEVWGDTASIKYSTTDPEKYEKEIKDYNKSDLQTHASKVGVIPIDSREMLTRKLMNEFKRHVASYNRPPQPKQLTKVNKEALKILSEGR